MIIIGALVDITANGATPLHQSVKYKKDLISFLFLIHVTQIHFLFSSLSPVFLIFPYLSKVFLKEMWILHISSTWFYFLFSSFFQKWQYSDIQSECECYKTSLCSLLPLLSSPFLFQKKVKLIFFLLEMAILR